MNRTENTAQTNAEQSNEQFHFYFGDFVRGFFKFWWVVAVLAIVFGGFQFYRTFIRFTPVYTVSSTFTVSTTSKLSEQNGITSYQYYYDTSAAKQMESTFPYILSSNIMQDAICEELNMKYVPATLSASSVSGSKMFTITCKGQDAQMTYDVLMAAIKKYPDAAKYVVGNIQFTMIMPPVMPTEPSNKSAFIMSTIKGIIFGLALSFGWIAVYAVFRRTIRSKEDIKSELGQEVIGVLPEVTFKKYKTEIDKSILRTNERIGNGFLESLRVLRNSFLHSVSENEKVILVTSTAPGEGKTTVTVNLALSLADLGKKILLIDGDVRNPSILKHMGIKPEDVKYHTTDEYFSIADLEKYNVSVLSLSLKNDYWKVMRAEKIKELFDLVRNNYDYIFVDTPPCGLVSDTSIIAQSVDASLYVIMQDTVRTSRIKSGLDSIITSESKAIGCIFNGAASGIAGYGENYGYGYGYGKYGHYGNYGRYGYGYGYGYGEKQEKRSHDS